MELKKGLTTVGVFSLGAGAMISSGLFILPSIAFSEAGVGVLISYFLAGLFMLPAVFSKLELVSAIPKAGGAFFYLTRIFGAPVGMITGFADWFSIALKGAFALVGIGVFGSLIFPSFGELEFKLIAIGTCLFFVAVNLISVEGTGRFQVLMVVSLLAILIGYLLVGYRRMDFSHFQTGLPLQPFKIITTTGMVFISYGGITKIAAAVEEIKDPKKILVPGILSAFLVVYVIYLLVVFVTIGAMDSQTLAASYSPLTDAAGTFFTNPVAGAVSVVVITAAGLLAFFTTTNAGILSASRVPLAIPHIVVEGESLFDLVLVRNRYGIKWTNSEVVYTAFGLIGSRDERNFHLRALMSIAQMLQDPHFNTAWHRAKNEKELKTAIILSQRKRHI